MLRAILFDLDGVLTRDRTGSFSTLSALSRHTGVPYDELKAAYFPHNQEMLLGKLTHADIWPEMCAMLGRELDFSLLRQAFIETPMNDAMLALVRELRTAGFVTGMITDNKADRVHAILQHNDLFGLFDVVTISAEAGMSKWEQGVFRHTLDALQLTGPECLFIDNTARNLVAAEAVGMHTLLFDDVRQDPQDVRNAVEALLCAPERTAPHEA